jgi:hypothetical protein
MKPEKLFNGKEFFPRGVCISSYPVNLEELDNLSVGGPPSGAEMADESDVSRECNKS